MKRGVLIGIAVVGFGAGMVMHAQSPRSAEVQMKAAQQKAEVEGDLKGAIEEYKKIVVAAGSNRALAAQALVGMAECFQKMGDAEAQRIYERVAREFSDQTEAVILAQTRLSARRRTATHAGMSFRKVWTGPKVEGGGSVSRDGRYVSFPDWETGDLALHDVVTGTDRHLTRHENPGTYVEYAQESAISRDGSQIAYAWFAGKDRYDLRLVSVTSGGMPESRRLFDNPEVGWIAPYDWSPDDQWIAVQLQRKDRTAQLGVISARVGSLRVLKSIDWGGSGRMFFSPDGKYLACDLGVSETNGRDRDVFLIATDGSRETHVAANPADDRVMGWSPDGSRLLFSSDRTGTTGLWAVAIADGRAQGAPVQIKQDISPVSIGVTASGALYVVEVISSRDVKVASVDLTTGKTTAAPVSAATTFVGTSSMPDWSPDGKYLAYVSARHAPNHDKVIMIRDLQRGQVRDLHVAMNYFGPHRWAPDGRSLVVKGTDLKGREGVYRVDAQTGTILELASAPETGLMIPQVSPDGQKLYFWSGNVLRGTPGSMYVERDLASGRDRELYRHDGPVFPALSPDGRHLAGIIADGNSKSTVLVIISVADGQRMELLRANAPDALGSSLGGVTWTPDGRSLLVARRINGAREDVIVPVNRDGPRKLELGIRDINGPIRIHPDGRQIAVAAGDSSFELWVLENFLPSPSAKK